MTASLVAGGVRARALGRRRLGYAGARSLALSPSLHDALVTLAATPYGHDVRVEMDLPQAQRAVAQSTLWNLRVLSGWLPASGAESLRLLVSWFEIANVDELLRDLAGLSAEPPYHLGSLATAWPQLAGSTSVSDLRERLDRSRWGGSPGPAGWEVQLGMRLTLGERVAAQIPAASGLAVGAVALLLARERFQRERRLPEGVTGRVARLLGREAASATSLPALATALPSRSRWVLEGVEDFAQLWSAEARWWRRLEERSFEATRSQRFAVEEVLGTVGLLAVDAWRVRAALALAGNPGAGVVLDAFDAVA